MHAAIETAFRSITKVLLGQELSGMQSYGAWLERDVRMPTSHKSALSDQMVVLSFFSFFKETKDRVIKLEEGARLGEKSISREDAHKLCLSNAPEILRSIKLYAAESKVGDNVEVEGAGQHGYSSFCCNGDSFVYSKYCAYTMWPRSSEYIFGSDFIFSSKFCLKCYNSVNLSRCFEVSQSVSCSDCYFCHNCENVRDSMFCFNAKNLKFAIGNREYPREEYMRIKALALKEISGTLLRDKTYPYSIYNVACGAKKKK
ncbi:MAG: hypothetical protein WCT52_00855 [Candidatus Micrarchaeia archaeon]